MKGGVREDERRKGDVRGRDGRMKGLRYLRRGEEKRRRVLVVPPSKAKPLRGRVEGGSEEG